MITAVISKKGGVGKTTTTVNLSAALAHRGLNVLLIDLDPNAGASMSLGIRKADLAPSVADLLLRDVPSEALVRQTGVENLHLITASVDLRGVEVELDKRPRKDVALAQRMGSIRRGYDHVLIDCPSSIGLLTRNAITAADGFIVPATPQFLAIDGLEQLVDTARRVALSAGSRSDLIGVLMTMADYRLRVTRDVIGTIRKLFGKKAFVVEVRTNVSLAEAPAYGQTIFEYKPNATGAKAYQLLAEEFLETVEMNAKSQSPSSIAVASR